MNVMTRLCLIPMLGVLSVSSTAQPPDAFEPDNTPADASWFGVDAEVQTHNFHQAGDEDWLIFYFASGETISANTENLGTEGDTLLQLYAADGTTLLAENDDRSAGELFSEVTYQVAATDFYYARVLFSPNSQGAGFGENTAYDLRIQREAGVIVQGSMAGEIRDAVTGNPITNAQVTLTNFNNIAVHSDATGAYILLSLPENLYNASVTADGYLEGTFLVTVAGAQVAQMDADLTPSSGGNGIPGNGCAAVPGVFSPLPPGEALLVALLTLFLVIASRYRRLPSSFSQTAQ